MEEEEKVRQTHLGSYFSDAYWISCEFSKWEFMILLSLYGRWSLQGPFNELVPIFKPVVLHLQKKLQKNCKKISKTIWLISYGRRGEGASNPLGFLFFGSVIELVASFWSESLRFFCHCTVADLCKVLLMSLSQFSNPIVLRLQKNFKKIAIFFLVNFLWKTRRRCVEPTWVCIFRTCIELVVSFQSGGLQFVVVPLLISARSF